MRKSVLFITLMIAQNYIGQPPCFDSLDFFTRTRTGQIQGKLYYGSDLFRESVGTFNPSSGTIQWCARFIGDSMNCTDPYTLDIQKRSQIEDSSSKHEYEFDKGGRIIKEKVVFRKAKGYNINHYYYTDSISNRIRLITQDVSNTYIFIFKYYYANNSLDKIVQTIVSLSSDQDRTLTTTFEYYTDGRPKKETTSDSMYKTKKIMEYSYKNY